MTDKITSLDAFRKNKSGGGPSDPKDRLTQGQLVALELKTLTEESAEISRIIRPMLEEALLGLVENKENRIVKDISVIIKDACVDIHKRGILSNRDDFAFTEKFGFTVKLPDLQSEGLSEKLRRNLRSLNVNAMVGGLLSDWLGAHFTAPIPDNDLLISVNLKNLSLAFMEPDQLDIYFDLGVDLFFTGFETGEEVEE